MTEKENSEQDTSLEKLAFKLLDHGSTFLYSTLFLQASLLSLYVVPPKSLKIKVYSNQIRANLIFSNLSTTIARAFGSGEKGFYVAG